MLDIRDKRSGADKQIISGGYWVRRMRRSPQAPLLYSYRGAPLFENAACSFILWYFTWFHEPQKLSKVFSK